MFEDLEPKQEEASTPDVKVEDNDKQKEVKEKVEEKKEGKQPEDMFAFVDKNEKIDQNNQDKINPSVDNKAKNVHSVSMLSIFAINSLAKFLIYAIISLLVVGAISFFVANFLT